jgi:putative flippase GtrA
LVTGQRVNELLSYEFIRFLIVGITTVIIDLLFYLVFLNFSLEIYLAKAFSFSLGAVFAYFANRNYTFQTSKKGITMFIIFLILYLSTLTVNVLSNEIILGLFSHINLSLFISFIIATSLSAALNFLGMKYIVFTSNKRKIHD